MGRVGDFTSTNLAPSEFTATVTATQMMNGSCSNSWALMIHCGQELLNKSYLPSIFVNVQD